MTMICDRLNYHIAWTISRYLNDKDFRAGICYDRSKFDGNLWLNEGIAVVLDLSFGLASPAAYSNANARIGVGDSNTAAAATQTDLQAATNKLYKGMESGYPQRAAQTVTLRSVFGSSEANFSWQEFTVDNGAGPGLNLNRKVDNQGTKASGQTWTVDVALTLA